MAITIKPEHAAAWEWGAAKAGVGVEEYAQQHLDAAGSSLEGQKLAADRAEQAALFELALQLMPESRVVLKEKVLELATAQGLPVPQE